MRSVAMLALAGLIALVLALVTGSTPLAVIAVALAIAGIVMLIRDWRDDRRRAAAPPPAVPVQVPAANKGLTADDFSPDISTDPNGPSSDARAD